MTSSPLLPADRARFNIPDLPSVDEYLPFLRQIEENRWYSNFGPLITSFEQQFSAAMEKAQGLKDGALFVKTVTSGYSALVVGLQVLGIGKGSRVLTPAINFPAGPLAVEHLGGEPIIADVDPETWLLTPEIAYEAAKKTKIDAVMPVSIYGIPLPAAAWDAFSRKTGIKVLIDAAAAVESQPYLKTGIVAHSLHALKPFGVGEGGLIVAMDRKKIELAQLYINFGMRNHLTISAGENAKISEMHAAVALAQIKRWPAIKERRRNVFAFYVKAFQGLEDRFAIHPLLDQAVVSSFMVKAAKPLPRDIVARLAKLGVCAHQTYFPPLYRHPHFAPCRVLSTEGRGCKGGPIARRAGYMPHAEALAKHVVGLPFHAFLDEAGVRLTVEALCKATEKPKK